MLSLHRENMAGKKLGIYFGKDALSMAEVDGKRITCQISLPFLEATSAPDASPDEIKLVAMIGGALRDNKIDAKKSYVGLSHKDQFIRGFQMLLLNKSEMDMGVLFEVKKYIPFKTEDLVFDYQRRMNKKTAKMDILFVAATRDSLDSHFSILNQVGLQAAAVEPASFALLRVLSLTKQLNPHASFALATVRGLDAEFTIIDKGFPCFSRDITFSQISGVSDTHKAEESAVRGRLASEIRVSLDYFRRQFSGNPVEKVLFLSKDFTLQEELILGLSEDLGLPVERVELENDPQVNNAHDLDMLKAYALALKDSVKLNLTVDLAKKKLIQPIVEEAPKEIKEVALSINVIKWPLIAALGLAVLAFSSPQLKINKANTRLSQLRSEVEGILLPKFKGLTFEAWKSAKTDYNSKIEIIEKLVKSRFLLLTPSLNVLPGALEKGLWLQNIGMSIRDGRLSLSIKGAVYLGERDAEVDAANAFYKALKNNQDFMRGLRNLELKSLSESQMQVEKDKYAVTQFEISGS